jgi:hypothetical protein
MKPIPFRPEPLPMLRMRYPWAVDHIHDEARLADGLEPDPAAEPHHVFDFADGLRLVVLRSTGGDGRTRLQVSASGASAALKIEAREGRVGADAFLAMARRGFRDLSRDDRPLDFRGFHGPTRSVPVWLIDEMADPGRAAGGTDR